MEYIIIVEKRNITITSYRKTINMPQPREVKEN